MYIGNFKIKVIKDDGSQVDVNEETQKRILLLKGKIDTKDKEEKTEDDEVIDLTHTVMNDKDEKNNEE